MTYHCTKCSKTCYSTHAELTATRFISTDDYPTTIRGTGLGTWRCPDHGKVAVIRKVSA